jgi:hypothetical protein
MASPFSVFRKNRTMMLVVLTILSMFGFVFLPIILQMGGSQSASNPVVVKSKYGDLRMSDLHNLRSQRLRVIGVLADALLPLGASPQKARQYLEHDTMFGPATDQGLVDSWLLSNYAQQMGMVVSNTIVNGFLRQVTFNRVRPEDFQKAFQRGGVTEAQFFSAMGEELLALQLKETFRYSLQAATPAERWKYFSRIKEQASIEAVPVPVVRYVDRVPEPSAADLQAFFEEHKEKDSSPDSPLPGFHEPKRIEMQYLKADYAKLIASVTDEQVKARYEKDKAIYDQMEKQLAPEKLEEKGPAELPKNITSPEKPATTEKPATPKAEKVPAGATGAKEKKAAGSEAPQKATSSVPQSTPPNKSEKKADEKKKGSGGTSTLQPRSPFILTAFAGEEKPRTTEAKEGTATEKPAKAADVKEAKATEKPAKKADAKEAKAAEKPAKASEAKETKTPEKPAKKAEPASKEEKKAGDTKAGPSDLIKARIRQQIVGEKLQKAFEGLREQVDRYRSALSKYEDAKIKGTTAAEPQKLDLEALAKQASQTAAVAGALTPGATGLISQVEARQNAFCNSNVEGGQPVSSFAFALLSIYRPEISQDRDGNPYLFWKTGEKPARVPKFDDPGVRAEVLRAWKMIQARKAAIEEAKNLADEARKSKGSLKQAFANRPDLPVVAPEPFSWLTFGQVAMGSAPGAVRLSNVAGVDMPGNEFMETVFSLQPGQIGTAMNAPQTADYIIRLTALKPSQDALWAQFKVDDFSNYAPAAGDAQRQIYTAWLNEIKTSANLKWTAEYAANPQAEARPASPVDRGNESDADY